MCDELDDSCLGFRAEGRYRLHHKIQGSGLCWSPDLRVAISLWLNALSILKTVTRLRASERLYPLSSHMIIAYRSGYPNSELMKAAFGLAERSSTVRLQDAC
jgi:hypothetical protein